MNISLPDYIWLRKGRPRTVAVVGQAPRVGRAYVATPPKDSGKPKMHVTVLAVESDGEDWSVTVAPGDTVDHPRLLRAAPGANPPSVKRKGQGWSPRPTEDIPQAQATSGDGIGYTTSPSQAMVDEPEAVPAAYQAGISAEASDRDHELRAERVKRARAHIDEGLALLEQLGHGARRAARSIRHHAEQIGGE